MKELSIEEKAKAYDEALKEAVIAHKDEDRHLKATLERIFPALKENEDEKLREQVIYAINQLHVCECTKDKLRAWVEKQGNNINCIYDKELSELLHIVICRYVNDPDISYTEREIVSKKIFPYVELLEKRTEELSDFEQSLKHIIEEAIEDGDTHNLKADADMLLRIAHKSTWDEDDENMLAAVIADIQSAKVIYESEVDWLKSLKDRVQLQPKQGWNDEDEKMVRVLMSICDEWATRHFCLPEENTDIEKIKSWLQSLKFNITDEELDKARKDAFNDALDKIEYHGGKPTFGDGWSTAIWYLKKRLGV